MSLIILIFDISRYQFFFFILSVAYIVNWYLHNQVDANIKGNTCVCFPWYTQSIIIRLFCRSNLTFNDQCFNCIETSSLTCFFMMRILIVSGLNPYCQSKLVLVTTGKKEKFPDMKTLWPRYRFYCLLFTTKFRRVPGTHLVDRGRMKG